MQKIQQVRNYDIHSWTGIILGMFVYVVSTTGCFALFYNEIQTWENPHLRHQFTSASLSMDAKVNEWISQHTVEKNVRSLNFSFPQAVRPYYTARLTYVAKDGANKSASQRWATNGDVLAERKSGLSEWVRDFHRDLMWPASLGGRSIGRALVGVAGIVLLLSILTGIIAHTKISRELFALRLDRSVRLRWQDTHKILGVWGLPFHSIIAFTGAAIGVIALLAQVIALLVAQGDVEALERAIEGTQQTRSGVAAEMRSIDEIAEIARKDVNGQIGSINYENWGDENARINISIRPGDRLLGDEITIDNKTGKINGKEERATGMWLYLINFPLHYGTYGGIALKLLYFILGLSLSVIVALGTMMWIERRIYGKKGLKPEAFYRKISALNVGLTFGIPVATGIVFHADKLIFASNGSSVTVIGWIYFASICAAIAWTFWRSNDYRTTKELLTFVGLLAASLPLSNLISTGDFFLTDLWGPAKPYAWVDMISLLLGLSAIWVATKLPSTRPEASHKANEISSLSLTNAQS